MNIFLGKDTNFLGVENGSDLPDDFGAVILPVSFEQTSSYGIGSASGPQAILTASRQVEYFDTFLGFAPVDAVHGIATLPFLSGEGCGGRELAGRLHQEVSTWLARGKCVVTLGGEHTSVVGAVRAYSEHFDKLTVLQLDAHSDLRESYQESEWNHACAMARVRDFNRDIVQVGIRSECSEESELVRKEKIPVFYSENILEQEREGKDWTGDVVAAAKENVYITFDCDVFDPSIMPATGTPEPAGLNWSQVDRLFRRLARERRIVGFDICELAPIEGMNHPQYTAAKLVYRLLGYISGNKARS